MLRGVTDYVSATLAAFRRLPPNAPTVDVELFWETLRESVLVTIDDPERVLLELEVNMANKEASRRIALLWRELCALTFRAQPALWANLQAWVRQEEGEWRAAYFMGTGLLKMWASVLAATFTRRCEYGRQWDALHPSLQRLTSADHPVRTAPFGGGGGDATVETYQAPSIRCLTSVTSPHHRRPRWPLDTLVISMQALCLTVRVDLASDSPIRHVLASAHPDCGGLNVIERLAQGEDGQAELLFYGFSDTTLDLTPPSTYLIQYADQTMEVNTAARTLHLLGPNGERLRAGTIYPVQPARLNGIYVPPREDDPLYTLKLYWAPIVITIERLSLAPFENSIDSLLENAEALPLQWHYDQTARLGANVTWLAKEQRKPLLSMVYRPQPVPLGTLLTWWNAQIKTPPRTGFAPFPEGTLPNDALSDLVDALDEVYVLKTITDRLATHSLPERFMVYSALLHRAHHHRFMARMHCWYGAQLDEVQRIQVPRPADGFLDTYYDMVQRDAEESITDLHSWLAGVATLRAMGDIDTGRRLAGVAHYLAMPYTSNVFWWFVVAPAIFMDTPFQQEHFTRPNFEWMQLYEQNVVLINDLSNELAVIRAQHPALAADPPLRPPPATSILFRAPSDQSFPQ